MCLISEDAHQTGVPELEARWEYNSIRNSAPRELTMVVHVCNSITQELRQEISKSEVSLGYRGKVCFTKQHQKKGSIKKKPILKSTQPGFTI